MNYEDYLIERWLDNLPDANDLKFAKAAIKRPEVAEIIKRLDEQYKGQEL